LTQCAMLTSVVTCGIAVCTITEVYWTEHQSTALQTTQLCVI